jgi:protein involved in polysaccharide export with SLBB domain
MLSPQRERRDGGHKGRFICFRSGGRISVVRQLSILALACSFSTPILAQSTGILDCSDPSQADTLDCSTQSQQGNATQMQPGVPGANGTAPQNQQPNYPATTNSNGNLPANYSDLEQLNRRAVTSQQTPLPSEPLTEFQKFVATTTGQILPIYGTILFRRIPSTFAPIDLAPVPPDYVIGPGDELRIRIWGQVNLPANVRVDRSGEIYLPQIGQVHVAGLTFSELDAHLREAVGRVFRNFDLTVDVGQIRAIQVYVSGAARRPGVYTVSSLSTLVDALFASGGPAVEGSMRSIELRRNGTVVTRFDLYDLLIKGDKTKDAKLLSGDVIFIPPIGPQAAVFGSVRNPAIFELQPQETLAGLLADAGGVSALAAEARVSIERIDEHRDRHAMEVAYDPSGLATALVDGDTIRVYPIVPRYQKTVTLRGNTANAGRFAWHEGMRVSELIPDKESLLTRNYWWRRAQMGLPTPDFEPVPGFANQRQPSDNHPIALGRLPQQPRVNGQNPQGGQNGAAQDQSGMQSQYDSGQQQNGTGSDQSGYEGQQYGLQNPYGTQQGGPEQGSLNAQQRASSATLASQEGAGSSGQMPASTQRTEIRLPAPEIDWDYAVIERLNPETLKTELLPFDLGKLVLQHDSSQDLMLQAGDIVSIFSAADIRVPVEEQTKFVRLEGEFVHAGVYSVRPGETLRDLIERAGGLTPKAYLYGSEFTRESTRALQQARIDEYVQNLALSIQRGTVQLASSATASAQTLASSNAAQASEQNLLAALRQIRATGRIVLTMQPSNTGVGSLPDIPMENGDRFIVPHVPSTVNVVGSVYNQNTFLFQSNSRVGRYLQEAGGPNKDADRGHEFVIRADGEVIARKMNNGLWGNEFNDLRIYPGDTVVVPEKTFKPSALYGIMNWSQMFSQLALGAASLSVIQ